MGKTPMSRILVERSTRTQIERLKMWIREYKGTDMRFADLKTTEDIVSTALMHFETVLGDAMSDHDRANNKESDDE